jgi:hypothetical protein
MALEFGGEGSCETTKGMEELDKINGTGIEIPLTRIAMESFLKSLAVATSRERKLPGVRNKSPTGIDRW